MLHSLPEFQRIYEEEEWLIHYAINQLHLYKNQDEYYQEGLIGLWEAYVRFDESHGASFRTFAFQTIRGKLLTYLRKSKRIEDSQATLTEVLIDTTEDQQLTLPLEQETILDYCEGLTKEQRRWVILHFIECKGQNQIAKQLGVSKDTVKSWRRYALQKIRRTIERIDG
ncbi:sigma-70 family RNA polymerase sigma factor [Bacillus sp. DJP31]|uniref:sigma-70 family RNA polymerase sigma factor n=1 Tax=Bacillus sp. DJP31 TaxID=3409789 RepID=UPI003BB756B1